MDKQEIAHILEKEISSIDATLVKLNFIYSNTIDSFQARDLKMAIKELVNHKQQLEKMIDCIVEDAHKFNPKFYR